MRFGKPKFPEYARIWVSDIGLGMDLHREIHVARTLRVFDLGLVTLGHHLMLNFEIFLHVDILGSIKFGDLTLYFGI